jgi:hypothetical protein
MRHLPTDRQILRAIYDRYYAEFAAFDRDPSLRQSKVFVPIDIPAIASEINADEELVFGRLYHHLDRKHGRYDVTPNMPLFQIQIPAQNGKPADMRVVNFPLLESVLASLELESRKAFVPIVISSLSFFVAACSLITTIVVSVIGWHVVR